MGKSKSSDTIDVAAPTVIPGFVRIVNLTPSELDPPLRGGHSVHLLPFSRQGNSHISEPIPKKYITDHLKSLKNSGLIDIREVTE